MTDGELKVGSTVNRFKIGLVHLLQLQMCHGFFPGLKVWLFTRRIKCECVDRRGDQLK